MISWIVSCNVFLCNVFVSYFVILLFCVFFFFKQKTAYEMRISDWSSDVCSSDLRGQVDGSAAARGQAFGRVYEPRRVRRASLSPPQPEGGLFGHDDLCPRMGARDALAAREQGAGLRQGRLPAVPRRDRLDLQRAASRRVHGRDRKSTRLNSSH